MLRPLLSPLREPSPLGSSFPVDCLKHFAVASSPRKLTLDRVEGTVLDKVFRRLAFVAGLGPGGNLLPALGRRVMAKLSALVAAGWGLEGGGGD